MLYTLRAMLRPGVPLGMMIIDAALWGGLSGLVTTIIKMKSAIGRVGREPLVSVDHVLVAVAHGEAS